MEGADGSASFAFPVRCRYLGGHRTLGNRGRHLWVKKGMIGHGLFHPAHCIPLSEVTSVEVSERQFGGSTNRLVYSAGLRTRPGAFRHPPLQITDVVVRTMDGQEAAWEIDRRGADWVRGKLARVLAENGVPFHDELPPDRRSRY